MRSQTFDLFRYQILPRDRYFQADLFGHYDSVDSLLADKNRLFGEALNSVGSFKSKRSVIQHRVLHQDGDSVLLKFAANRSLTRETREFTEEEIENWPSFLVFVWNDPSEQQIAIQERGAAFRETDIVARVIETTVSFMLADVNLRVYVEAQTCAEAFWTVIDGNRGKVMDVRFELITPNLSNLSQVLSDDLKELAKATNAAKTRLDLIADPDSAVFISEERSPQVESLVEYSSEGAGDISVKVRGLKRRVHTSRSKRHIEVDEATIKAENAEDIVAALKGLLG